MVDPRRSVLSVLVTLSWAVAATGCGQQQSDPESTAPSASPSASPSSSLSPSAGAAYSLRVTGEVRTGKDGILYEEGSVPYFRLTGPDGAVVVADDPDAIAAGQGSWSDLPAATYTITAGQQPCDGNCGYLDGPADTCTTTVDLREDTTLTVDLVSGRPCVFDDPTPTVSPRS